MPEPPATPAEQDLSVATILIIDDELARRECMQTLLSPAGHRVLQAGDGSEGLATARVTRPDLVIAEILLPTMDGCELARRLDEGITIIFSAARSLEPEARAIAEACGVAHVLLRPSGPERVLSTVEDALRLGPPARPIDSVPDVHVRQLTARLQAEIARRKRADEALEEERARERALARRLAEVQEAERLRIARYLHDEFGQLLGTLNFHLFELKALAGEAVQKKLDDCQALLQQAGEGVRNLALSLRPTIVDRLGLQASVRWLVDQHRQRTGVNIALTLRVSGQPLDIDVAVACFRIVQETLFNVARHAQAREVAIELVEDNGTLKLTVRDDGIGFDVATREEDAVRRGRLGLLGMRERAQILGGTLSIDSQPGRGTRVRATLPLNHSPASRTP